MDGGVDHQQAAEPNSIPKEFLLSSLHSWYSRLSRPLHSPANPANQPTHSSIHSFIIYVLSYLLNFSQLSSSSSLSRSQSFASSRTKCIRGVWSHKTLIVFISTLIWTQVLFYLFSRLIYNKQNHKKNSDIKLIIEIVHISYFIKC